jgi:hypothetical protein
LLRFPLPGNVRQPDNIEKTALIIAFILVGTVVLRLSSVPRWEKFTAQDESFSVFMPTKPNAENQSVTVNGVKLDLHSFSAWSRAGAEFTLPYADAPMALSAAGEKMLDAQLQHLSEGDERRTIAAEKLNVNGYSARKYKGITKDGFEIDEKLFLVGRRIYILLVVDAKGTASSDVTKFFDSFAFKTED